MLSVASSLICWGVLVGLIHFAVVGALYGNPLIDRLYAQAQLTEAGVRRWSSRPRYLATQFLGTQVEVFILVAAFVWLRPYVPAGGLAGAVLLGAVFAAIRVYPRFWNMWIQSTYPARLLAVELVNGVVGTFAIVLSLQLLGVSR